MKKFKVIYQKTVPCFSTGEQVSENDYRQIDSFKGKDEIRKGGKHTYLVVAGTRTYGNSRGYGEHVFRIVNAPNGFDITGLNAHNVFEQNSFRKEEITVSFGTPSEIYA